MIAGRFFLAFALTVATVKQVTAEKDFYELLGVEQTADSREIRKAFKKLAITTHPDKNPDDPLAQQKFLDLKQAYEVLKDQETRKQYDLHGENGIKDGFKSSKEYQNWNFYKNHFGIYDDDPEIITLSASDFEQNVKNSMEYWFIKFYSPMCSHCHVMSPNWRQLALELSAVIKIAAVNCEEDWVLCRKEGISSYPSLVLYPNKDKYYGERTPEDMQNFVLHKLPTQPNEISSYKIFKSNMEDETIRSSPLLFIFCKDSTDTNCPSWQSRSKLSYIFDGLVEVAYVDCSSKDISCSKIGFQSATIYLPSGNDTLQNGIEIHSLNYLEIATQILRQLPEAELVDEKSLENIHGKLFEDLGQDWLVYFTENQEYQSFVDLQYRRLPALLPHIKLGRINCNKSAEVCKNKYFINKYPTFATFKRGGAVEMHVGGVSVSEVVNFARNSIWAPNLETLNPNTFPDCLNDGHPWVVDFYAPWCPPCMRLIPEFRRASSMVGGIVKFGSLDCATHRDLCATYDIRSYPTVIFYNYSTPHAYTGQFVSRDIATFVEDVLRPPVIDLTIDNFESLVLNRGTNEVWLVDFFASWCGPCIQLAPQWRSLARMVGHLNNINIGSVDCVTQELLCTQHGVRSYPTIRLYPIGGTGDIITYNGFQRDAYALRSWLVSSLPSSVYALGDYNFADVVLRSNTPWVVDYYAPWCGPCQVFAVEFELAAKQLDDGRRLKFAKVNCESFPHVCRNAGIQSYPTVRYYPGKTGWSPQNPFGVPFVNDRRKVEDVVEWLEELLVSQSPSASGNNAASIRDEL